ncbi:GGDEF domain-containing protein [Prosthecochloris sp. GSB1]|uniref:GGDEF domain-containing protein n=1 Tax=Prosthecochloris sp. GSB1 TaxID=281093 RepID=UPI000B8CE8E7|nr:GGDEF domain-containing protein [Prosthecochloris sp. GSB1]ASQ90537.1 GGDEF domain-containing protein [Prosthecochloris sp. GSB1]
MQDSRKVVVEPISFRPVISAGIVLAFFLLAGTAAFLFYQAKLQKRADELQMLYKDLLDFRSTLTLTDQQLKVSPRDPEILREIIQNTKLLQFRSVNFQSRAEKNNMPDLADWINSQRKLLEKTLTEIDMEREDVGTTIPLMVLEVDDVILQTGIEARRANEKVFDAVQVFLFFVLGVLLIVLVSAVWLIVSNYRQTVIPLNQLAGKLRMLNEELPESFHDTAEEVKKDIRHEAFSSDINEITDSIVRFCQNIDTKNKKLDELFIKDEKTNLYNYRHFKDHLIVDVARAKRFGEKVALAMIDIDHFKAYNDANGHVAGDIVLERIARIILEQCRESDIPARFGGEEFAVVFPRTESRMAVEIVERLRQVISAEPFYHEREQPGGQLTISAGVAMFPEDAVDWYSLVNSADKALYHAKKTGRNRVVYVAEIEKRESGEPGVQA